MPLSSARTAILAAAALTALAVPSARAEIRGMMDLCPDGKLCPWFQVVIPPPVGWVEDAPVSQGKHLTMLVPRGKTFDTAAVRIYATASLNAKNLSTEERVRISNVEWKEISPRATVERLADVPRPAGKAPFQLYRYGNPDRRQQAAELTAFGEEEENGARYGILIVLTAKTARDLAGSEAAYRELLGRF